MAAFLLLTPDLNDSEDRADSLEYRNGVILPHLETQEIVARRVKICLDDHM